MRSTVHSLFPTPVWEARLAREAYAPLNDAILRRIAALRQGAPDPPAGSGWQSPVTLHRYAELAPLLEEIDRLARAVLGFLRIGECEPRVSVSFNLMFPRFAETLAQPLWGED